MEGDERWYPLRKCPWPPLICDLYEQFTFTDNMQMGSWYNMLMILTTLVCFGSTPSTAVLNSQLKLVHNWVQNSKMSLNHGKSSVMWFKTKPKRCLEYPNILIHDTILKSVHKQKYLGIFIDSRLSWIYIKFQKPVGRCHYLYLISSPKHCLSADLIKLLIESLYKPCQKLQCYTTMIRLILEYANTVWSPPREA